MFDCFYLLQKQRDLENRLDKSNLKCREAEHIQKTYLQIKMKLEDEQKSFGNTLDSMEHDIIRSDAAAIMLWHKMLSILIKIKFMYLC